MSRAVLQTWRLAMIAATALLAVGCADDPEVFCGDDIGLQGGLEVSVEGRDPDLAYDFAIDVDGTSLVISAGPGQASEPDEADLGNGRRVEAWWAGYDDTFWVTRFEPTPGGAPSTGAYTRDSMTVPTDVEIVARTGGVEVGRASLSPTASAPYYPWGMSCMYTEQAHETLLLSTPP